MQKHQLATAAPTNKTIQHTVHFKLKTEHLKKKKNQSSKCKNLLPSCFMACCPAIWEKPVAYLDFGKQRIYHDFYFTLPFEEMVRESVFSTHNTFIWAAL